MENIDRVTEHIRARLARQCVSDADRRTLTIVETRAGTLLHVEPTQAMWRMYRMIEGAVTRSVVSAPIDAERAGRAFGEFQHLLIDLPGPRLHETIPGFHDTPAWYDALDQALGDDAHGRVAAARQEIDFALARRASVAWLVEAAVAGAVPERIVHNDAKIDNILFDEASGEALCVVDLDTVMPGSALCDFGDMVRTMTVRASEDETELAKIEVDPALFEALARGYFATAGAFLTPFERSRLVDAGRLIALEQGVRFLADFLAGDTYYKVDRPGHNLDRCRTQFKIVASLERQEGALRGIVDRL